MLSVTQSQPEVVLLVVVSVTAETREASLPRGLYSHVETVPAVPLKDEPEVGHFHEGEQPGDSQRDSGTNREGGSQVSNDLAKGSSFGIQDRGCISKLGL